MIASTLQTILLDYNTQIALLGTTSLGAGCGIVGTFLLMQRRSLLSDTLSHSTLPGVALAFLLLVAIGGDPKSLPWLLVGGAVAALVAALLVAGARRIPRVRDDAALAVVLSTMFGAGLVLLGIIQQLRTGVAAGLGGFLDGHAAAMSTFDAWLIAGISMTAMLVSILGFKELTLVAFDPEQARLQGLPVRSLQLLHLLLAVALTVAGLVAVGLLLIVALLVIPAATARLCSHHLPRVATLAALFGAVSGALGTLLSSAVTGLPTGALIVLFAALFFGCAWMIKVFPRRGQEATA